MIRLDMWYGDRLSDVTRVNISWSDLDCVYRGNMFIGKKYVGDYTSSSVQEIEKAFPHLSGN